MVEVSYVVLMRFIIFLPFENQCLVDQAFFFSPNSYLVDMIPRHRDERLVTCHMTRHASYAYLALNDQIIHRDG